MKDEVIIVQRSVIVAEVKSKRMSWTGHVLRTEESVCLKGMWNSYPEGRRQRGRLNERWKDQAEEDLRRRVKESWMRRIERGKQSIGEDDYYLGYR